MDSYQVGAEDAVAQAITLIPTLRPKVVFAHWSDTIRVNDRLTSNCGAVGAALIQYTGTPGSPKIEGTKVVGLPYDTLKENIDSFLLHAGASDRITEEELLLLVAIDPKLERLLAPFSATSSPFKAPSSPQAKENSLRHTSPRSLASQVLMRQVFITNLETEALVRPEAQVAFHTKAGPRVRDIHFIQEFKWSAAYEGDVVYVIDVHFQYEQVGQVIELQEQGGVDVYRHLLAHYAGKSESLRVVFYSPIPKEELVRLRPENYVLNLLPFAEGSYSEDFAGHLDRIIAERNWPQFNNASENLLSGWSLASKEGIRAGSPPEPIATDGHKVLVIDDEMPQWETALNAVIGAEHLAPPAL